MKTLFTFIIFLTVVLQSFAQDTIRTRNNEILIGTVKEISDDYISYTRIDQAEGPIRKLSISQVSEIQYQNGTKEIIRIVSSTSNESGSKPVNNKPNWEPGTINNTGKTVIIPRKGPDLRVNPGEQFPSNTNEIDRILGDGVYIDGMIGYGNISRFYNDFGKISVVSDQNFAFGIRFGSKYYFGKKEKMKIGINIAWVGVNVALSESRSNFILFNPVNIGPAMVFKLNEQTGIEVNTSAGMVISNIYESQMGLKYGFDVKWRYNSLALGLDYSRSDNVFGSKSEYSNIFSISAGMKF